MTHPDVIPEAEFIDSTDAMLWARAMSSRIRAQLVLDPADEGWLVGWFANAMGAQERALQVVPARIASDDPLTNAVADLADAMAGLRDLADRAVDREMKREADEADEDRRRQPVEWEQALTELERWLNAQHVEGSTGDPARGPSPTSVPLVGTDTARKIIEALDRELRRERYTPLRRTLRTLGGDKPPKDLRAEAEQYAGRIVGSPEARSAAVEAYLAGAGVER